MRVINLQDPDFREQVKSTTATPMDLYESELAVDYDG